MNEDSIYKKLVLNYMQVNYCSSCGHNTSETHFLSNVCKHCFEDAYENVLLKSILSIEVKEYNEI